VLDYTQTKQLNISARMFGTLEFHVDDDPILSNAMAQGFSSWINGVHDSNGIISSWFSGNDVCSAFQDEILSILYFSSVRN
jgi:methyltransferase-like protein 6